MRSSLFIGLVAVALAQSACGASDDDNDRHGSGGDDTTTAPGGTGGAATTGGGAGGAPSTGGNGGGAPSEPIPDPGDKLADEWPDVEPNDSPGQATPVGVLSGAFWMGFTQPPSAINPEADVDYYVFKTGPQVGVYTDLSACYSFAGDLLDLFLYDVVGGFQGTLVASSTNTSPGCDTLLTVAEAATVLKPATTYLLEVRAGAGLVLGGDPGLYYA